VARDRNETETVDFKSDTRPIPSILGPRPSREAETFRTEAFFETLHNYTSELYYALCFSRLRTSHLLFTSGTNVTKVLGIISN